MVWMSYIDIKIRLIPDRLNLYILTLAAIDYLVLISIIIFNKGEIKSFINMFMIDIEISILILAVFRLLNFFYKGAIGGGDIKLMMSLVILLGSELGIKVIVLGFIYGGLYGLFSLIFNLAFKRNYKMLKEISIPMAPFFTLGVITRLLSN